MRNYVKMFACLVHGVSAHGASHNFDEYFWADNEKVFESRLLAAKASIASTDPQPFTYDVTRATVYFELNKANLAVILNGGSDSLHVDYDHGFPKYVWHAISQLPAGKVGDTAHTGFFDSFTVFESPRATWSDGH